MRLVIFGANGPVGRLLTEQALNEGHLVTSVTRHPDAFAIRSERLRVVAGDVFDQIQTRSAIEGQDAVISTFGVAAGLITTVWLPFAAFPNLAHRPIEQRLATRREYNMGSFLREQFRDGPADALARPSDDSRLSFEYTGQAQALCALVI